MKYSITMPPLIEGFVESSGSEKWPYLWSYRGKSLFRVRSKPELPNPWGKKILGQFSSNKGEIKGATIGTGETFLRQLTLNCEPLDPTIDAQDAEIEFRPVTARFASCHSPVYAFYAIPDLLPGQQLPGPVRWLIVALR